MIKSSPTWLAIHLLLCGGLLLTLSQLYLGLVWKKRGQSVTTGSSIYSTYQVAMGFHFLNLIIVGLNATNFIGLPIWSALAINGTVALILCVLFGSWLRDEKYVLGYACVLSLPMIFTFSTFLRYCLYHSKYQYLIIFGGLWEFLNLLSTKSSEVVREGKY